MSKQKSGKSPRNPSRLAAQKFRTYKNKQRQRKLHAAKYPNDTTVAQAKRWVEPPTIKKA